MSDKILSLAETSALLNVSEVTVKRWVREHLLKAEKNGSELSFAETDVIKYKEINDKLSR